MIYEIGGKQVILDFDLAKLFNYEVKRPNEKCPTEIHEIGHGEQEQSHLQGHNSAFYIFHNRSQ